MPADPARAHVLIVDDEPVILQILSAVFEDEPYRVTTVSNGADALALMAEQTIDVLLTDKNLPDHNGMDLLAAAKQHDPLTEVILLTGYASLETALKALALGAFDYLVKPLDDVFAIKGKVHRALERRTLAQENIRLLADLKKQNAALESALGEARSLQRELIQSEKLAGIGTLAAGIAHEVSSPLFGIMGLAEAISDEESLSEARSHAREIVEYCQSIRDIVKDLTSYSRSASRELGSAVALEQVVRDAAKLVERSANTEGVRLVLHADPDAVVQAHANELQQVFVNLIRNATEAVQSGTRGSGTVVVKAGVTPAEVWATVTDDGVGIPTDDLDHVFDPFYTTKEPGKGTGLGLNVAYRIVTKVRGTISVESTEGRGTVFRLRFPRPTPEDGSQGVMSEASLSS